MDFKKDITIHMSKMPDIGKESHSEFSVSEEKGQTPKGAGVSQKEDGSQLVDLSVVNKEQKIVTPFDDF